MIKGICKQCNEKEVYYPTLNLCRRCYNHNNLDKRRIYDRQYTKEHREEINRKEREKYKKNRLKISERSKIYYQKNKDRINFLRRQSFANNKEEYRQKRCEWEKKNHQYILDYSRNYRAVHKEECKEKDHIYMQKYYKKNRNKILDYQKIYGKQNRTKISKYYNKYNKNRLLTDINYKLCKDLSIRIRMAVKNQNSKKAYKSMELLGCTIQFFREHIEKQFKPGMSWNNYGNGPGKWVLDHIIACIYFILREEEQQKLCFNFTNYQPLWWKENMEKGCKIEEDI